MTEAANPLGLVSYSRELWSKLLRVPWLGSTAEVENYAVVQRERVRPQ